LGFVPEVSYMQLSAEWSPIRLGKQKNELGICAGSDLHAALCLVEPDSAR
jgi:hypothetical protein